MTAYLDRMTDAPLPYQKWQPFPPEAIVQVVDVHDRKVIGPAYRFWWGYEPDFDGVIVKARRLDKPKRKEQ